MSKLNELNLNLTNVLLALTKSQDLCKLLYYNSDNPLSEVDITDTSQLMYSIIYPMPKIPDVKADSGSLVTVFFDDIRLGRDNTGYKNTIICIHVLCHINEWKITGAIRPYVIMNKIDEVINNQRIAGLGKMQFERARFSYINDRYSGYRLDYRIVDFN